MEHSAEDIPVKFRCHQFPVQLAFAMTINKSQGQSVANVGLDLHTPVFSHGQLYVALSCCTSESWIKVLFPENEKGTKTKYSMASDFCMSSLVIVSSLNNLFWICYCIYHFLRLNTDGSLRNEGYSG